MFRDFFKGRYGVDALNVSLFIGAAILFNGRYTWFLALAMVCYALFRVFSKNINKRYEELQKFNLAFNRLRPYIMRGTMAVIKGVRFIQRKFTGYRTRFQQRKQYVFVKCSKCKNTLRLPRNMGKLSVTCPVCKLEFIRKT